MTIETVIEWAKGDPVGAVMLPICALVFLGVLVFWTRCLWRWVAGRQKAPKACPVCGNHEVPIGFADWEPWNKPASSCDVRYTCRCCGAEVWHEVAHDGKRAGWRCAPCLPACTLEPAPDHKYQGDQVSGLRGELLALEERIDRRLGDAEARLGTVEVHVFAPHCAPVTPAPVEAGVRVFINGAFEWLWDEARLYTKSHANWCVSGYSDPVELAQNWRRTGGTMSSNSSRTHSNTGASSRRGRPGRRGNEPFFRPTKAAGYPAVARLDGGTMEIRAL